jgi:type 1 glutamine amidotransferase
MRRRTLCAGLIAVFLGVGVSAKAQQTPLKVCLVSGSEEYKSDDTLAQFKKYLEAHYPVQVTMIKAIGFESLPGLEALDDCDVALFFTRRLTIKGEQLEKVKKYALSKKPLVGVRSASHGFQNWLDFDKVVYGGNYKGHTAHNKPMTAMVASASKDHPVLEGVGDSIQTNMGLYRTAPVAKDAEVLMNATVYDDQEKKTANHPVTWVRTVDGKRVCYTSLGAIKDFDDPKFLRLLANALFWAAGRDIPAPK